MGPQDKPFRRHWCPGQHSRWLFILSSSQSKRAKSLARSQQSRQEEAGASWLSQVYPFLKPAPFPARRVGASMAALTVSVGARRLRSRERRPPAITARSTSFTFAPCRCAASSTDSRLLRSTGEGTVLAGQPIAGSCQGTWFLGKELHNAGMAARARRRIGRGDSDLSGL